MTTTSLFPLLAGGSANIEQYLSAISAIPLLSVEQELALAERLQQDNDVQAAQQLILSHLRFVAHIARGYMGYGLPFQDLIQEGNIGLMKAVKRFDAGAGVRLTSFAVHWIKSEIHDFVLRNWAVVKIATTKAQRKLFFNLRKMHKQGAWFSPAETERIAADLNVPAFEVSHMEGRMSGRDVAYDIDHDDDDTVFQSSAHLVDPESDFAEGVAHTQFLSLRDERVKQVFSQLSPRSQDIVYSRIMAEDKATLVELAERYNVSHERIRQLEKQALTRMKENLSVH